MGTSHSQPQPQPQSQPQPQLLTFSQLVDLVSRNFQRHLAPDPERKQEPAPEQLPTFQLAQVVYGRATSTMQTGDPVVRLSAVPRRKVVFVFGSDAILSASGTPSVLLTKSPYDLLIELGHTPEHIYKEAVVKKYPQKLVLFTVSAPQYTVVPATWHGVLQLVKVLYPQAYDDVKNHLDYCMGNSIAEIEQKEKLDFRFSDYSSARDFEKPLYMSYERYINLPQPRKPWQTRFFLYCELRLLEMFTGDGYTKLPNGARGPLEYICPNCELSELKDCCAVLDMDVQMPEAVINTLQHNSS